MQLFKFSEAVGMGLPLWLPNGFEVRNMLQKMMMDLQKKEGYQYVLTPHMAKSDLYKISGHYEKYKHSSFSEFTAADEEQKYMLKPMNCPHHAEIYKSFPKSYKELPVRLAENGNVSRYEASGTLHGMTRVRTFCQDDAHIFCTDNQLDSEISSIIELIRKVFRKLGFEKYEAQISVRDKSRPSDYIGSPSKWDKAEQTLVDAAEKNQLNYTIVEGEAAFYGPKIDIQVTDSMRRKWQLSTIQVDYQLPERFALKFIGADGHTHQPVMIHRAIFGSYERLVAILIEHHKGKLPLWLAPVQILVMSVINKPDVNDYCKAIRTKLQDFEFRVELNLSDDRISKKIRNAKGSNIPIIMIVGEKEVRNKTISVRMENNQYTETITSFLENNCRYLKM